MLGVPEGANLLEKPAGLQRPKHWDFAVEVRPARRSFQMFRATACACFSRTWAVRGARQVAFRFQTAGWRDAREYLAAGDDPLSMLDVWPAERSAVGRALLVHPMECLRHHSPGNDRHFPLKLPQYRGDVSKTALQYAFFFECASPLPFARN
jgi:hypothetical protein